jgi:preprotein translocase subunit SecA
LITLRTIDDLWADYLADVAEFRSGLHWLSLATWDPHREYLKQIDSWFIQLEAEIPAEIQRRLADAEAGGNQNPRERGAVWTYVTTDQPFGTFTERIINGFRRKARNKQLWG